MIDCRSYKSFAHKTDYGASQTYPLLLRQKNVLFPEALPYFLEPYLNFLAHLLIGELIV